jgi:hypothetical protein
MQPCTTSHGYADAHPVPTVFDVPRGFRTVSQVKERLYKHNAIHFGVELIQ